MPSSMPVLEEYDVKILRWALEDVSANT
jgi:hypothetical protein